MPVPRIAIVGFDGMDVGLVRRWAGAGLLPTFSRLLDTSSWEQFTLAPEYSSGMVWPSINTGLEPSAHQNYFGIRLVEGTYRLRARHCNDLRGRPFWHQLAAHGRRLVLMDVPFARADPAYGGRQIIGWGQHEWGWPTASHPAELLTTIRRSFGPYPVAMPVETPRSRDDTALLLDALLRGVEQRTKALSHLARGDDWDFFYAVFQEAHSAGHSLWHLSDRTHPRHDPAVAAGTGDPLLRVYSALDRSLGELMADFGPDLPLMIILSHGMGPNYNGDHLFSELLDRFNASHGSPSRSVQSPRTSPPFWESTIGRLPPSLRKHAERHVPPQARRWLTAKRKQHSARWRRAASFALPGLDGFSAVRVNLRGREPDGFVATGTEYSRYLDALQAEAGTWTVGSTGQRAIQCIHRAAEGTDALRIGAAPDLMIWWEKHCPIEEIRSPKLGVVRGLSKDERTGEHVMHSLLMLRDREASTGLRDLRGVGITDVGSLVCELAGVPPAFRPQRPTIP